MRAAREPALGVYGIHRSIDGTEILHGIDLEARRGQFTGLVGPNGSGKTTLLRVIAGLGPADSGRVELAGTPLAKLRRRELARRLALVEQMADTELELSVMEVVLLGRIPHQSALRSRSGGDDAVVARVMEETGVAGLADRRWNTLSGGERQRVHLARALAQEPELLLLDEPTNHLDIGHQLALMALVRRAGVTTVAALHDLNLAAQFCDHVVMIDAGRVVAAGAPSEVLTAERIALVFQVGCRVIERPVSGEPLIVFYPQPSEPTDVTGLAEAQAPTDLGDQTVAARA